MKIKKSTLFFPFFLLFALSFSLCSAGKLNPSKLPDNTNAPSISLYTRSGEKFSFEDYSENNILIVFMATTCSSCKKELPQIQKLVKNNSLTDTRYFLISVDDKDSLKNLDSFLNNTNIEMPVLLDKYKTTAAKYQILENNETVVPALFYIGKNGKILFSQVGYNPQTIDILKKIGSKS